VESSFELLRSKSCLGVWGVPLLPDFLITVDLHEDSSKDFGCPNFRWRLKRTIKPAEMEARAYEDGSGMMAIASGDTVPVLQENMNLPEASYELMVLFPLFAEKRFPELSMAIPIGLLKFVLIEPTER